MHLSPGILPKLNHSGDLVDFKWPSYCIILTVSGLAPGILISLNPPLTALCEAKMRRSTTEACILTQNLSADVVICIICNN